MVVMTSFPPPTEGLVHVEENTEAFIHDQSYGPGTLYIATERLSWSDGHGKGFSLEYPAISLHAICRDTSQFQYECIYCMMDSPLDGNENDADSDDSDGKFGEVRFVPEDKSKLEVMFRAMSDCQILHPNPQEQEDEEDEDFFCDADEEELSEQGQRTSEDLALPMQEKEKPRKATLQRLEGMLEMPSQQEFMQMTSVRNGGDHVNGHGNLQGDVEMDNSAENSEQFEDADK